PAGWLSDCDFIRDGLGYEKRITEEDADKLEGLQGRNDDDYTIYLKDKGLLHLREDKVLAEQYARFGHSRGQGVDAVANDLPADHTIEGWCAAETSRFIKNCVGENSPFVCWMTMPHPHQGYAPAREFWNLYDENELTLPPNADSDFSGRHETARNAREYYQTNEEWRLFEPGDWDSTRRRILKGYYACVTQVDDAVGRVMKTLDDLGIRDNTIVIYSADHGEFAGEHGMVEKAPGIAFRCVTRIPFIASCPGFLPRDTVRNQIIESVDFLPTVASLAGVDSPDWCDGLDASPVFLEGQSVKEEAFTEHPLSKTVHTERYKFTYYQKQMCSGKDFGELYDMIQDPWELNNLYFDPSYQDVVNDLRRRIVDWLITSSRHLTIGPSPYVWKGKDYGTWDLAEQLYDEDGRLGKGYFDRILSFKDGKTTKVNPINYL
ncbi:MAG: sulfatase-like hydrolase/transferase, partial [Spirochaetales bacterium]|nr:sulfatase-like hydrolase/transferase [Spirochaetales bacterium]